MNDYRFDGRALHIAKHIMQLREIARIENWNDARLLAAIQNELIAAMKWSSNQR
ncbi:hypothetical protein HX773_19010 [Pantoea sp. B9002]|uniref:hypothetical protein n=1 Tax=Pantoea sp. B9002 TaxID=2726979 RepID=UPI0015A0DC2B|nr:hypothetical protein [Pantoea sp. B9002]NWA62999.1 hypothetical protein [Pantoea sp. B9002]